VKEYRFREVEEKRYAAVPKLLSLCVYVLQAIQRGNKCTLIGILLGIHHSLQTQAAIILGEELPYYMNIELNMHVQENIIIVNKMTTTTKIILRSFRQWHLK
jgi:hypothetical protein